MTYDEFLQQLAETPRKWFIRDDGAIRLPVQIEGINECHCPLSAVAGTYPETVVTSRIALKMPSQLGASIARAADGSWEFEALIRRHLLQACGLTETAQ